MLKDHINMMLVYLFIIVLLFCIMYLFIYNDKELIFDNTFNNTIKNNTIKPKKLKHLKNLMMT